LTLGYEDLWHCESEYWAQWLELRFL
jgi:hypothetical protein